MYRYRTRALLLLPLFANSGMLLGPLVGGLLSSQDDDGVTSKSNPYALPNIFAAAMFATAAIGVFFGLEETLESLKKTDGSLARRLWNKLTTRKNSIDHDYTPIESEEPDSPVKMSQLSEHIENQEPPKKPNKLPFRRIWTWNVICTMLAHFIIAGHIATFTNLWAIFLSTPAEKSENQHPPIFFSGGLGMQPRDVGFAMSALGAVGVTLQLVIYPRLNDRFGTVNIWRSALYVFPIAYALAPFPALVGSADFVSGKIVLVWLSIGFVLLLFIIGRTGVTPATTLLINDCTPHPSVRGTIHTAGTVIGNMSRSLFPIVAFTIFGKGLDVGVVGLGFWCLACLGVLACVASRWVTEGTNGKEIVLEGEEPAAGAQVSSKGSRK
jgi:MFS family permease